MARSKKPRSRPDPETSELTPEDEVTDPGDTVPAKEEEAAAPRKSRRKRANLEVKASGDPEEVAEALNKVTQHQPPAPVVTEEGEEESPEDAGPSDETLMRLLSNPRNKVIVFRTFPKRWNGAKCDTQVDPQGYRCPASFEDIKQDVFRRFGGKSFTAYIQPVTITGHGRPLAAIPFENPDTEDPTFEMPTDPNQVVDPRLLPPAPDGGDPTMMPEEDPMAAMEQNLKTQMRIASRRVQLAQLNQQLKEFEATKDVVAAEASNPQKGIEERIALMQMDSKLDRQIDAIRVSIDKISSAPAPAAPSPPQSDGITKILMAQLQMAENRFNALMQQQTQLLVKMGQGGAKDDLDSMLEKVTKFKAAFGEGDSRVKRLEQTLMDIALERITEGGGDGDGESDVRFAIKNVTPILKNFVDKKLTEEPAPTKEEFQLAVQREASRAIQSLVQQGHLIVKNPQQALPAPPPAHPKVGAPPEKKSAPPPKPAEPSKTVEEEEEDDRMNVPPGPSSPAYSRRKAVDFVLDSILRDIDAGFPEESYVIGDALDRLDDEVLDQLLTVSSGEELEKVVGPHCDPAKIQAIKDKGKNPRVKTWLTRVITTIQDEYRREVESGEPDQPETKEEKA